MAYETVNHTGLKVEVPFPKSHKPRIVNLYMTQASESEFVIVWEVYRHGEQSPEFEVWAHTTSTPADPGVAMGEGDLAIYQTVEQAQAFGVGYMAACDTFGMGESE